MSALPLAKYQTRTFNKLSEERFEELITLKAMNFNRKLTPLERNVEKAFLIYKEDNDFEPLFDVLYGSGLFLKDDNGKVKAQLNHNGKYIRKIARTWEAKSKGQAFREDFESAMLEKLWKIVKDKHQFNSERFLMDNDMLKASLKNACRDVRRQALGVDKAKDKFIDGELVEGKTRNTNNQRKFEGKMARLGDSEAPDKDKRLMQRSEPINFALMKIVVNLQNRLKPSDQVVIDVMLEIYKEQTLEDVKNMNRRKKDGSNPYWIPPRKLIERLEECTGDEWTYSKIDGFYKRCQKHADVLNSVVNDNTPSLPCNALSRHSKAVNAQTVQLANEGSKFMPKIW